VSRELIPVLPDGAFDWKRARFNDGGALAEIRGLRAGHFTCRAAGDHDE
jgi:hypothetical protein